MTSQAAEEMGRTSPRLEPAFFTVSLSEVMTAEDAWERWGSILVVGLSSGWAQLTAFFTSAPILASSAAVNSFSAKEVGHMVPSSMFASSLKPNVAYLELNFCALWK